MPPPPLGWRRWIYWHTRTLVVSILLRVLARSLQLYAIYSSSFWNPKIQLEVVPFYMYVWELISWVKTIPTPSGKFSCGVLGISLHAYDRGAALKSSCYVTVGKHIPLAPWPPNEATASFSSWIYTTLFSNWYAGKSDSVKMWGVCVFKETSTILLVLHV